MTPEQTHYAWDRLTRAALRPLSDSQRTGLVDTLLSQEPDEELKAACGKLKDGSLAPEEAAAGLKAHRVEGFDIDKFRASLAPKPDPSQELDSKLAALLA